jgi:hypothetical protein
MEGRGHFTNIYEAQRAISELIKNDNNCSVHFKFHGFRSNRKNKLDLVTYNPKTETHFLFHSLEMAVEELELYVWMYEHVVELKNTLKEGRSRFVTYEIVWYNNDINETKTSFFYGVSIRDILNKFYYEKHPESHTIFSMKLTDKFGYTT